MASDLIAVVVLVAVLAVAAVDLWFERRRGPVRHKACLRRIDRLERDLFPEWFTRDPVYGLQMRPGAVWQLSDPDLIQYHRPELERAYFYSRSATSSWIPDAAA